MVTKSFLSITNTKLIRINPDNEEDIEGILKLKFGAKKALNLINLNKIKII
tara:strand:+ start:407 stop:559 length:153 start_codon:yes stop_codon:yes gene_type:complete